MLCKLTLFPCTYHWSFYNLLHEAYVCHTFWWCIVLMTDVQAHTAFTMHSPDSLLTSPITTRCDRIPSDECLAAGTLCRCRADIEHEACLSSLRHGIGSSLNDRPSV